MQTDPYVLIQQIENANSWQEIESFIDKLIAIGKPAVTALLEKMPKVVTTRLHYVGAKVFASVSYPANAVALEFMVTDGSILNSSTYDISRDALISIGAPVLPVIIDALEFYRCNSKENYLEIDSLEEIEKQIRKQML